MILEAFESAAPRCRSFFSRLLGHRRYPDPGAELSRDTVLVTHVEPHAEERRCVSYRIVGAPNESSEPRNLWRFHVFLMFPHPKGLEK